MAGEELNAKKMKVSELRDALKERGLSTEGLKGDLVNRLEAYLEEQEFALPGEGSDLSPTPTGAAKPAVEEPAVPAPALEETKEAAKEKAELEKETATAGTEPSPAPVVPPEPTKAAAATTKTSENQRSEMTFEEKRAARAARFGIPMVETKKTTPKKRPQNEKKGSANKKPKKGTTTEE
jgi:SAP domain-containing ribonucleoprotein